MPVHIVKGDLLKSNCTVIAHQCNCFSTMGSGIAKQIKQMYPEAYHADYNFPYSARERLGKCSRTYARNKTRVIVNLYGQFQYGRGQVFTDYIALTLALKEALSGLEVLEKKGFPVKFGMPKCIGAGLAGGDWDHIYNIIEELADEYNRDIYLYKLK